jgi:hypothetical protein
MFSLSYNFLKLAAGGVLLALIAASTPANAGDMVQNLGPVAPHEPMIASVGSKRVVAFYVPSNGGCDVQAVAWNDADTDATTATGFRLSLDPGQRASIDTPDNKSLTLRCGDYADRLEAVEGEPQFASK